MSRIGTLPITIPPTVTLTIEGNQVRVKGAKGEMEMTVPQNITVTVVDQKVNVKRDNNHIPTRAAHGLTRSLLNNMVLGVETPFVKKLELVGTGYRAKMQGRDAVLSLGFSHPITYTPPEGIDISTDTETVVVVTGIDKQKVGQVAAEIRAFRKPEPYKGKGVRYQGEVIRRKAGKAAKAGSAG